MAQACGEIAALHCGPQLGTAVAARHGEAHTSTTPRRPAVLHAAPLLVSTAAGAGECKGAQNGCEHWCMLTDRPPALVLAGHPAPVPVCWLKAAQSMASLVWPLSLHEADLHRQLPQPLSGLLPALCELVLPYLPMKDLLVPQRGRRWRQTAGLELHTATEVVSVGGHSSRPRPEQVQCSWLLSVLAMARWQTGADCTA